MSWGLCLIQDRESSGRDGDPCFLYYPTSHEPVYPGPHVLGILPGLMEEKGKFIPVLLPMNNSSAV